jgi:hypothetical protein
MDIDCVRLQKTIKKEVLMSTQYIRTFILLPIKRKTSRLLKRILHVLSVQFGGATLIDKKIPLILRVLGAWLDKDIKRMVTERHLLLIVDVESSRVTDVDKCLSGLIRECKIMLRQKEIYMTYQPIRRVA